MMSPVLQSVVTRFAPSPTGELHLGSAYSAWAGWHRARETGGTFLVRIEDIDIRRCKREYETSILADLKWLGFDWDGEVRRQSEYFADYGKVLDQLDRRGLVYPCFCSRAAIERELAASANAPHAQLHGPDGPLYPGTCRHLSVAERRRHIAAGHEHCLRLDSDRAAAEVGPYHFFDESLGRIEGKPRLMGDFVIARKDTPTSYHLSVTDARGGCVALDACARPAAEAAGLCRAAICAPQAFDGRDGPAFRQARPRHDHPGDARERPEARRCRAAGS